MTAYLLGLDVSTTGSKALLIDAGGAVAAVAGTPHPLDTPRPGWSEQNPADWWSSSLRSIREVLERSRVDPGAVAGIGLTGQMHGLVPLDATGEVVRPSILWNDQRTGAECAAITAEVGAERVLRITGNRVLPGFTAPKLVWLERHEPEAFRRIARVLLPKDYLRFRLTGAHVTDVTDAAGTSLLDVGARAWSAEMLDAVRIPRDWMPEVTESPVLSARVSDEAARLTGLRAGTPVASGAGDNAAAAVGSGVVRPGQTLLSLGTSGVVFAPLAEYRPEPEGRLHTFCHAVPGQWHAMGVILSAAGSLRWFRDLFAGDGNAPDYERLLDEAAAAPPGAEGLVFLPYLTGERTPHPDPDARGAWIGLSLRHGRPHLARAVLEGVGFALRDAVTLIRGLGLPLDHARLAGGGGASDLWRGILADTLRLRLASTTATEGAAFGAALLAGVGAGVYSSVELAADGLVAEADVREPGADADAYDAFYDHYRALYPALASHFAATARTLAAPAEAPDRPVS